MRRTASFMAALAVVALALGPALAEARPGGGRGSMGSRGSQTYTAPPSTQTAPGTTRQFDRTEAPRPGPGVGQPGTARPAPAGGAFANRSPLMAGLMGGLLGAGLFGLFFGGGLFGGLGGIASLFGLLLQLALIGGLVWLVLRLVRGNRQPAMAGGPRPGAMARDLHANQPGRPMNPAALGGAAAVARRPVQVAEADYQAFERVLQDVNAAWSRQDLEGLRRVATAEMTNYFAQDLNDLRARGWTNVSRDVRLESGDLAEAWHENGLDFATVAMRFSLVDVTTDAQGRVVEGDPAQRTTATEVWTFVRRQGDAWKLSAIQQTG
ncbi:MAG TPA: TIM44-like domain-containing protein [Acetobacteraceae bacterium]|jgi:predicted lipid-binding transport protein (Tim44 family)|nr:TIM44-like domain-containing protein [Acetobacteraceae bacterium]